MSRGTRRLELYRDDDDRATFMDMLGFALRKSGCAAWAYTVMANHYHLVLEGSSDVLTACMARLNRLYAGYHNQRYGMVGHAFDGPYLAFPQATVGLSIATLAYVFLNPVKAGLCAMPEDYRWSGYRCYLGLEGAPLAIDPGPLMERVDPHPGRGWQRFHDSIRREQARPPRPVPGRPTMLEAHLSQLDWLLEHARENPALLAGEDPVPVAVYWARRCGIAPRVLAKALGLPPQEVRQMLRAFTRRLAKEPGLVRLSTPP
jgi:hypothetical protein